MIETFVEKLSRENPKEPFPMPPEDFPTKAKEIFWQYMYKATVGYKCLDRAAIKKISEEYRKELLNFLTHQESSSSG